MIVVCRGCDLQVPGPGEGVEVPVAEVEAMRVWHVYEAHPDAWEYLTVLVPWPAVRPTSAPEPSARFQPRPARLPRTLTRPDDVVDLVDVVDVVEDDDVDALLADRWSGDRASST